MPLFSFVPWSFYLKTISPSVRYRIQIIWFQGTLGFFHVQVFIIQDDFVSRSLYLSSFPFWIWECSIFFYPDLSLRKLWSLTPGLLSTIRLLRVYFWTTQKHYFLQAQQQFGREFNLLPEYLAATMSSMYPLIIKWEFEISLAISLNQAVPSLQQHGVFQLPPNFPPRVWNYLRALLCQ